MIDKLTYKNDLYFNILCISLPIKRENLLLNIKVYIVVIF